MKFTKLSRQLLFVALAGLAGTATLSAICKAGDLKCSNDAIVNGGKEVVKKTGNAIDDSAKKAALRTP